MKRIAAEKARRSLAEFFRHGWHVLESTTALDWNWHIPCVCDHIQAVLEDWMAKQGDPAFEQRIRNLLVNIPPGTAKSRIVSVYAPAWMWLRWPSWKGIFLSANPRVALRDSILCRELIESRWYREWFDPDWKMAEDQNAKSLFKNTAGGSRQAFGWFSKITGDRADTLFVDDPHDADEVNSPIKRRAVLDRWKDAIYNRVNDARCSPRIGIMQRVHSEDWSAYVLESGDWEHLCLPQEYEPERVRTTAIGWSDPRVEPGELLFPQRFPPHILDEEKKRLGSMGYAGQHQQRPVPAGGGMFRTSWFEVVEATPKSHVKSVRYWDLAATLAGDFSVGLKMVRTDAGIFYIEDVVRGQWGPFERDKVILQTANLDGRGVPIRIEQEPGSSGVSLIDSLIRMLAGFTVHGDRVTGDKPTRAAPLASQCEAGNVKLVAGAWVKPWLDEVCMFPLGKQDDQVDAASGAFAALAVAPRSLKVY